MATLRRRHPSRLTSRSGVAPRNVRPPRPMAKSVDSGAVARSRSSTAGTSMADSATRSTCRARTTLSRRPRPTAPASRDTDARQSAAPGRLATSRSEGRTEGGEDATADPIRSTHHEASVSAADAAVSPGESTWLAVSHVPSGVMLSSRAGRTTSAASKPRHTGVRAGTSAKPKPPSSSGPQPRSPGSPVMMAWPARSDQASATCVKRPGPLARIDQAAPTPSRAKPSLGWQPQGALLAGCLGRREERHRIDGCGGQHGRDERRPRPAGGCGQGGTQRVVHGRPGRVG